MSASQLTIVNTRPTHQAQDLHHQLQALGATVIDFPCVAIDPPDDLHAMNTAIHQLADCDSLIITSVNACRFSVSALHQTWQALTHKPACFAVGQTSADVLQQLTSLSVTVPQQHSSEGLLALPALQNIHGQSIFILTGAQPRPLLTNKLSQRGAIVRNVICYQRNCPEQSASPLYQAWTHGRIDLILITSAESLNNLWRMVGKTAQAQLKQTCLLVTSERQAAVAHRYDWQAPIFMASHSNNQAICEAVISAKDTLCNQQHQKKS